MNDSFIFLFTDRNNLQSTKVGYCNNNQKAVYCYSDRGPTFGGGRDLCCKGNGAWYGIYNQNSSYPKVDIPYGGSGFCVDDYEVFQVVKM